MNDDLRKKLEEQRKWRTVQIIPAQSFPAQPVPSRRKWTIGQKYVAFALAFLMAIFIFSLYFVARWAATNPIIDEISYPSPTTESAAITTEETTNEAQATMRVCAGNFDTAKLHVRFEPGLNSDVRGYLEEGEAVMILSGEQNEPITQIVDDVSWTIIQSPITGWVSTSHLCK